VVGVGVVGTDVVGAFVGRNVVAVGAFVGALDEYEYGTGIE